MIEENKISRFILELIKKTKKKIVQWEESYYAPTLADGSERLVDLAYSCEIGDKIFRLFKYNIKHYRDEYEWDWSEKIKLELIDNQGNSTYEFPYEYSLYDLYNAVRESTSGIDEFIDEFLNS